MNVDSTSDRDAFSGVETLIGDGKLFDLFFGEGFGEGFGDGTVEHVMSRTAKEMKAHKPLGNLALR